MKISQIMLEVLKTPQTTYSACDKYVILAGLPDSANGCPEIYRRVLGSLNYLVRKGLVKKESVWLGRAWGVQWSLVE